MNSTSFTATGDVMNTIEPQEGAWYTYEGRQQPFQVINVDSSDRVVYFQDMLGDIDELDFDEWYAMGMKSIAAPQSWQPDEEFDDEEREYRDYSESRSHVQHSNPK
jgi:hypothetical protein